MFNGNTAASSVCCGSGPASFNPDSGANVSLPGACQAAQPLVNVSTPSGSRSIFSRDVAFPMRDPYSPVTRARVPVPGLNRFPGRYDVMPRSYYAAIDDLPAEGSQGPAMPVGEDDSVGLGGFGFGDLNTGTLGPSDGTGSIAPIDISGGGGGGGGGIDWGAIINAGLHDAPAIIQAATKGGTPAGFYTTTPTYTQQQYYPSYGGQTAPQGYAYTAAGQLIQTGSAASLGAGIGAGLGTTLNSLSQFVTANPLLILGGGLALLLLFKSPPGRR